jgi:hypothetical protein
MNWDVVSAEVAGTFSLRVKFRDGVEGVVRFLPSAFRGVFACLMDSSRFRQVSVVDGVVTWPGDLDLAPDAMHDEIQAHGEWVLA